MKKSKVLHVTKTVFFVILLLAPLVSVGQTKRALLIGIGAQKDHNWSKINGDIDIPIMLEVLKAADYEESNIITLIDQQATKDNIQKAFATLTNHCRRGDIVYVHFSGHGQQMTDLDGDEPEGLDETWIPFDAYNQYGKQDNGSKHLSDDEVNAFLKAIRRKIGSYGKILVVVDACHSGSSTHGVGNKDEIVRGSRLNFTIPKTRAPKKKAPNTDEWITLSACKWNQTNSEYMLSSEEKKALEHKLNITLKSKSVGKLTYAIYYITMRNGKITNDKFMKELNIIVDKQRGSSLQTAILNTPKNFSCNISDILK